MKHLLTTSEPSVIAGCTLKNLRLFWLSLLLTWLHQLPVAASPSSLSISGPKEVACSGSPLEYRAVFEVGNDVSTMSLCQWHWHVDGGKFTDGSQDFFQMGDEAPVANVKWLGYSNYVGRLTLSLCKGESVLMSTTEPVRLGIQDPRGIMLEDGPLSCEGNWFTLRSDMAFTGGETVEWTVVNGLDINGTTVHFLKKTGADANRIYLTLADKASPMQVSARIRGGCTYAQAPTKWTSEEFEYPNTRLTGSEVVEIGNPASFAVCMNTGSGPNKKPPIWQSTGLITHQGKSTVTVKFQEVGTHEVGMTFEDCSGEMRTVKRYVRVVSKDAPYNDLLVSPVKGQGTKQLACRVYPNPVSGGILNVDVQGTTEGQLFIVNLQGRVELERELVPGSNTVDTKTYPKGLYLLRVISSDGEYQTKISIN